MGLFATWRHIKRLRELEDRVDTLERQQHSLDLEWSEVSEDLRIRLAKIAKRSNKLERLEQAETNGAAPPPPATDAVGLTPGQAQAQLEVLARRKALGVR